jgi:hypothetical protein
MMNGMEENGLGLGVFGLLVLILLVLGMAASHRSTRLQCQHALHWSASVER